MTSISNRSVVLNSRPVGIPKISDFALISSPVPNLAEGEVLRKTIYLSLDPYMRGRMNEGASYAASANLSQPMVGGTVSQVIASKNASFSAGDFVLGYDGWQEYGISDGAGLRKLDPKMAQLSYHLGVLGMPGLTAYAALLDIGKPQPGETVVVSAAAGAVGTLVGQIAKIKGCRAVGLAGTAEKCQFVVEELGFDACINYKIEPLDAALKAACPEGIDVYYDNTAGPILEAVLGQINLNARIPLVGLISQYNDITAPAGPNLIPLLIKRALIHGFLVVDHSHREKEFLADMTQWLNEGKVKYREEIVEGLENAPKAFLGLFSGKNTGKLLIKF